MTTCLFVHFNHLQQSLPSGHHREAWDTVHHPRRTLYPRHPCMEEHHRGHLQSVPLSRKPSIRVILFDPALVNIHRHENRWLLVDNLRWILTPGHHHHRLVLFVVSLLALAQYAHPSIPIPPFQTNLSRHLHQCIARQLGLL